MAMQRISTDQYHVLVIAEEWEPHPSPNGRFLLELIEYLHKEYDITADVLCSEKCGATMLHEKGDWLKIYGIRIHKANVIRLYKKAARQYANCTGRFYIKLYLKVKRKLLSKLAYSRGIRHNMSKSHTVRQVIQLNRKKQYNLLMSMSNPFSAHLLAHTISKWILPNVAWLVFMLDMWADNPKNKLKAKKKAKIEDAVFYNCNTIFLSQEILEHSFSSNIKSFIGKTIVVPTGFIMASNTHQMSSNDRKIKLLYSGILDNEYRNPEVLCKLVLAFPDNYQLHMYSKGCEEIIARYSGEAEQKIITHGYVSLSELEKAYASCDILVNIGNTLKQVPSKIFRYMSTGKPIINLLNGDGDLSQPYFELYPLCFQIKMDEILVERARILEFCENSKNSILSFDDVKRLLAKYTIENVANTVFTRFAGIH